MEGGEIKEREAREARRKVRGASSVSERKTPIKYSPFPLILNIDPD